MAKKHKVAHHGGSWKVAYADFVTAMMALFLCLWLSSQDRKIKDAVERAFRNPFSSVTKESVGIIPSPDKSTSFKQKGAFQSVSAVEMETMRRLTEDLEKLLKKQDPDSTSVRIDLTPNGLMINIFDRAHKPIFKPDTDAFTSYGSWVFSTLAWEIARYSAFRIEIQGHTASGAEAGNGTVGKWELSTERANAARRELVQNGVAGNQICKVSGYADVAPMPGYPPNDEINRRVTVMLKLHESVQALSDQPSSDTTSPDNPTPINHDAPTN